jgi:hypothetical protein
MDKLPTSFTTCPSEAQALAGAKEEAMGDNINADILL